MLIVGGTSADIKKHFGKIYLQAIGTGYIYQNLFMSNPD